MFVDKKNWLKLNGFMTKKKLKNIFKQISTKKRIRKLPMKNWRIFLRSMECWLWNGKGETIPINQKLVKFFRVFLKNYYWSFRHWKILRRWVKLDQLSPKFSLKILIKISVAISPTNFQNLSFRLHLLESSSSSYLPRIE